jgi:hypothetical protein
MQPTLLYILTDFGRTQMYIGQSLLQEEIPEIHPPLCSLLFPGKNLDHLIYLENCENPQIAEARKLELLEWRKSRRWKFIRSVNPRIATLKRLSGII